MPVVFASAGPHEFPEFLDQSGRFPGASRPGRALVPRPCVALDAVGELDALGYHSKMAAPPLSDAIELVRSPFRTSEALALAFSRLDTRSFAVRVVLGTLRNLFVVAAFVVLTSAGRLTLLDTAYAMLSFGWVPVVQAASLAVAHRCARTKLRYSAHFALHLEGHAPWSLAFTSIAGLALFSGAPERLLPVAAPLLCVAAFATSVVLTFASFRAGAQVAPRRALFATAAYYGTATLLVLAYFSALGQLAPILPARGGAP